MRIRNSSRVGFSLLSAPQVLHRPGSSFAPDPFVEKPAEEAKQHPIRVDASMRGRGGYHLHGQLQEGEIDGEVRPKKNQMALSARGFEDPSIFFDADGSKSSLRMNIGGGVSAIIEQALRKNEREEERLNITGERSSRRRRVTKTKNSAAQISQGDARRMEGEARVIPLKKRKAISSSCGVIEKETKTSTTSCGKKRPKIPRKRIPNKEAGRQCHDDDEATTNGTSGTLMEGSRCSRINGRGWRCCQQTLVGYSLCEHHLGKGRLKSMSAVRRRPTHLIPRSSSTRPPNVASDVDNIHGDAKSCCTTGYSVAYNNQPKPEENETTICSKNVKRRKLGSYMVKARSITSLLNQTPHTTPNYPSAQLPLDLIVPVSTAAASST